MKKMEGSNVSGFIVAGAGTTQIVFLGRHRNSPSILGGLGVLCSKVSRDKREEKREGGGRKRK